MADDIIERKLAEEQLDLFEVEEPDLDYSPKHVVEKAIKKREKDYGEATTDQGVHGSDNESGGQGKPTRRRRTPSSKPEGDTRKDKLSPEEAENLFWKTHREIDENQWNDRTAPIPKLWRALKNRMSSKEVLLDRLRAEQMIQLERRTTTDGMSQEDKDNSYHKAGKMFYTVRRLSTEAELNAQRARAEEIIRKNEE